MKQLLTILAVFFTVVLSSCSNEDIEMIDSSNFQINISTQSVYDDFKIAEPFKNNFLGGKGYSIGVFTYIYDNSGSLATSDSIYVDTFGKVSQEFNNLRVGDYTLITLEMLVENNNNQTSPNWLIAGQDHLETLRVVNKNFTSYWYSAIGLYTENINISKGNINKEIVPKGIGCIISTTMSNFNFSNYVSVDFLTKDQPKGRLLSPTFKGEDRFVYDHYNESHTWTTRGYYFQQEGLPSSIDIDVYLLEEGLIRYCFGAEGLKADGTLDSSFYPYPSANSTFQVADGSTYYGGFVYTGGSENSDCQAGLFNFYYDYKTWYDKIISSYSTSYIQPYLTWGASSEEVNTYMINSGLNLLDSDYNSESNIFWTAYSNNSRTVLYEYQFDSNKNNLNCVFMNFDTDFFTISDIKSDLTKLYGSGEYSSDLEGYIFASGNILLLLSTNVSDGYITVLYVANTTNSPKKSLVQRAAYKYKF